MSRLVAGAASVDSPEAEFDSRLIFELLRRSLGEVNDYFVCFNLTEKVTV